MDKKTQARLVDVAAGRIAADMLIVNARVVDVFTGGIAETPVSVAGGFFAGFSETQARHVLDAQGQYMLPGLIDPHVHIESSMLTPERFADAVAPRGTTTVIADPHEIANVGGRAALDYMLEAVAALPIDVRIALPSCVPAVPFEDAGAVLDAGDLAAYIDQEKVLCLAEMMNFPGVIARESEVFAKLELAAAHGKKTDGHAPGLAGRELDAYVAAGVRTDHECTGIDEVRDRLRRGMYVHLRQGAAGRNLAALLPAVTLAGMRRCLFCSDDVHPETLCAEGHMDRHLRLAVSMGLDPVLAVTMATLNPAECYGLNKGAIAPGREADFVLMPDLKEFRAGRVFVKGRMVADRGRMVRATPTHPAGRLEKSINMAPLPDNAFDLPLPSGRARVIGLVPGQILTQALERTVRTTGDGLFDPSANPGINLLAVIERHHATGRTGLGLIEGYGLRNGAVASSVAHDSHNVIVAGDNARDMRLAVETLRDMDGGVALCRDNAVLAGLPLPIGGLMSASGAREVHETLREMLRIAREEMGIAADVEPFMSLSFLALPVIPSLRLTARGLFDVRVFDFVPVRIDD